MLVVCCSVAKLFLTLCDPVDCSPLGFPALTLSWILLKLLSIELVMLSNHFIVCHPLLFLPSISSSIRVFPINQLFIPGDQNIGVSASAPVLQMNIQGWFCLGLTGLISLLSKVSQESSPALQFESINSSVLRLLYGPILTSIHDYWKDHSLD